MSDWPTDYNGILSTGVFNASAYGQPLSMQRTGTATASAWPQANRCILIPIVIDCPVTAYKIFIYVGAAAGTVDVGFYKPDGNLIVSNGGVSTVGTNALQLIDITDTYLTIGRYYMAMVASTVTTLTLFRATASSQVFKAEGAYYQDLGSAVLPSTVTLGTQVLNGYIPVIGFTTTATDI